MPSKKTRPRAHRKRKNIRSRSRTLTTLLVPSGEPLADSEKRSRLTDAIQEAAKAHKDLEAFGGLLMVEKDKEIIQARRRYEKAALTCVRIDKRMLYLNPDVRRCIKYAQEWGRRSFFDSLSLAVRAGVGVDKRLERRELTLMEAAILRLKLGLSFKKIADRLGIQTDAKDFERDLRKFMRQRGMVT